MKYNTAQAFRDAIDSHVRSISKSGDDIARYRRLFAFDRLLARLATADQPHWLLKGGAALEFRLPPNQARTTKDIDLALNEHADAYELLVEHLATDPFGDHFEFVVVKRRSLASQDDRGPVTRLTVGSRLNGFLFQSLVVDIVTPHAPITDVETIQLGHRLSFADLPIVDFPVINLQTHWAEKLSAYLRDYQGRENTRVKDLIDLVLIIDYGLEPSSNVVHAVTKTFTERSQPLPSSPMRSMADAWSDIFLNLAHGLELSTTSASAAHDLIEAFWQTSLRLYGNQKG